MRAVLYCRVSSIEQTKNLSLPTQEKACREYCARQGYDVDAVFIDAGESAKTTDRPEFGRLLAHCRQRKGTLHAVVVYSLTRFSRNSADHHAITALLRGLGITLRSVTEPIDESPSGRLMEGILASMAQFDNDVKSERVTAGMQAALERGRWVNRPPLGYRPGRRGGPSLEPDPERAPLVREAFTLCAAGIRGRALIQRLTLRGLRTNAGHSLTPQTLNLLLRNRAYLGVVRQPSGAGEQRGDFEPIVDEETFARVQLQLVQAPTSTRAIERHRNHPAFPLRRFARCAVCEQPLTGSTSRGRSKGYAFYHCKRGCTRLPVSVLEAQFITLLDGLRPKREYWNLFKASVVAEWQDRRQQADALRPALKKQIAALTARERRLDEAFLFERSIDQATYHAQRDQLREQLAVAQIELADLRSRADSIDDDLAYAYDVCARARLLWLDAATVERRQQIQWVLFPKGITVARGSTSGAGTTKVEPQIHAVTCWEFFDLTDGMSEEGKNGAPNSPKFESMAAWLAHLCALRAA